MNLSITPPQNANWHTTWSGIGAGTTSLLAALSTISVTQEGQALIAFLSPETKIKVAIGSACAACAFRFWNSVMQKDRNVTGGSVQQDAAGNVAEPQVATPAAPTPALPDAPASTDKPKTKPKRKRSMKPILSILCILSCLAYSSCATNPDGTLTDQSRANLQALEQLALDTAVNVGTQAIVTGHVDTPTIVSSINNGASVLQNVIATQPLTSASAPQAVQEQLATTATTKAVANQVAPQIADAVSDAVAQGVPAKQAVQAAANGLKKGAAKLKAKQAKT